MLLILSLLACTKDTPETPDDTGTERLTCADGLYQREFVAPAEPGMLRRDAAGDFTLPLANGESWTFSEHFDGCDVMVWVPHSLKNFSGDRIWEDGVADLVDQSPANAIYVFYVEGIYADSAVEHYEAQQARVDEYLATLDEEQAAWWSERLLVVAGTTREGWTGPAAVATGTFDNGMAIDRLQQLRGVGSYADVRDLNNSVGWYDSRLERARHEVEYLNWEAQRAQEMEETEKFATRVDFWQGDIIEEYEDITVTLPSADEMSGFDTLEVEVLMECPDSEAIEQNNCGAWDYLAYMWVLSPDGETWWEVSRFITTYHRESHWVVDGTHALPWLAEGGEHTFRFQWAPSWNTQPTAVTASLRLSNQGKGYKPVKTTPLFTGGDFTAGYTDDYEPIEVAVSSDAKHVELVTILTGHGMETNNCAEFCDHRHFWDVDGAVSEQSFTDVVGDQEGCSGRASEGVVPNQGGTWWFGRGGWCPGEKVEPFVVDATEAAADGSVTVDYYSTYKVQPSIPSGSGNIELRSWLVEYQ